MWAIASGINFDSFFAFSLSFLFLPFVFINYISQRFAFRVYSFTILLLTFIQIAFTHFFLSNGVPLSNVLLEFSFSESFKIAASEFTFGRIGLWLMYFAILGFASWICLFKLPKINFSPRNQKISLIIYSGIFIMLLWNRNHYYKSIKHFDSYFDYYIGNNKGIYFAKSVADYLYNEKQENDLSTQEINQQIDLYHKLNPNFSFTSEEYPLLHKDSYPNALGGFFKKTGNKPNVVLLIVEGLSGSFCGDNTYIGHFTPFLDSLSKQSLYWNHFLSNAEHSYGSLPNILASAPYGTDSRGLINIDQDFPDQHHYPKHFSLINLLQQNGYATRSFYGGGLYFDQIGLYMNEIGLDCILDGTKFNSKYKKPGGISFSWGYNDKDLFSQSFEILDTIKNKNPYLNLYITLSLHSPFDLCTKQYYNYEFLKSRLESTNPDFDKIYNKVNKDFISAALFTDDAIKQFFETYKKRSDYDNTIFIITGDHRVETDIPFRSEIDYFHVPLIIYSPLLATKSEFQGVSGHIDILPSLIELFKSNYNMQFNYQQHWMGMGLDTSLTFRNDRSFSLSLFSSTYPNFLHNDYLISSDHVSKIDENFNATSVTDPKIIDSMQAIVKTYRILNKYVCKKDKICRYK
ncbi:MAG: LTA synthase family protein [Bacteroidetes bacterium]|nr:LTA synthase family protein [Bacteroidota bacterium]